MIKKRVFKVISIFIYCFTALLVAVVVYLVVMKATGNIPRFFDRSILQVVSPSMEDEIPTGSYILIKNVNQENVKPGDVITFYSSDPAIYMQPNTHRVLEVVDKNGKLSFVTKGDNNQIKDSVLAKGENLIGKYEKKLPVLSAVGTMFNNKFIFLIVVLIPAAVLMAFEIRNLIRKSKQIKKEELIEKEIERLKQEENKQKQAGE